MCKATITDDRLACKATITDDRLACKATITDDRLADKATTTSDRLADKATTTSDRLADKATTTGGVLLGSSEVLCSLRHYLRAESQGHHTNERLEEKGVGRGSGRQSSLKGRREGAIASHGEPVAQSKSTRSRKPKLSKIERGHQMDG